MSERQTVKVYVLSNGAKASGCVIAVDDACPLDVGDEEVERASIELMKMADAGVPDAFGDGWRVVELSGEVMDGDFVTDEVWTSARILSPHAGRQLVFPVWPKAVHAGVIDGSVMQVWWNAGHPFGAGEEGINVPLPPGDHIIAHIARNGAPVADFQAKVRVARDAFNSIRNALHRLRHECHIPAEHDDHLDAIGVEVVNALHAIGNDWWSAALREALDARVKWLEQALEEARKDADMYRSSK